MVGRAERKANRETKAWEISMLFGGMRLTMTKIIPGNL